MTGRLSGASGAVALLLIGSAAMFLGSAVGPRPSGSSALALTSLAGAAAVLAARGWMRRAVGVLLAAAGLTAIALGVDTGAWWAVVGGVATTAGGAWTAWRGPRWSRLSERYDRTAPADDSARALWEALDRGEDPTQDPGHLPQ